MSKCLDDFIWRAGPPTIDHPLSELAELVHWFCRQRRQSSVVNSSVVDSMSLPAHPASNAKESAPLLANQPMSHSRRDPSPTLLGMFSPRTSYNNPDDPLTAALLGSIPRDETPVQRQQRLALEAEARRISDDIDERLRQERIERGRKKVVKVLLLGRSSQPISNHRCKLRPFTPGQILSCA